MDAFIPVLTALLVNPLLPLTISLIALILSIVALIYARKAAAKIPTPAPVRAPARAPEAIPQKPVEKAPKAPEKAVKEEPKVELLPPPPPKPKKEVEVPEIKPKKGGVLGLESLEELASMMGMDSILIFNTLGMPIESHNVSEEDRVAASLADFISVIRKFDSSFKGLSIENERRTMILMLGKVGEMELSALTVGKSELEIEEVRDLLKTYISDMMGG
ncbi:MAG: hypothetical protein J7K49_02010 [Thaumarchaeota archaeon]|nr:hypothetical protein [Nitrososphaerota archaeon]